MAADVLNKQQRSENMRLIRSRHTKPEQIIRKLIRSLGCRFKSHAQNLPGKPDFVLTGQNKIIEVRGCFWHQHTGCGDSHVPRTGRNYWVPKLARNVARDRRNRRILRRQGWKILVIWECGTRPTKLKRTVAKILRFLEL